VSTDPALIRVHPAASAEQLAALLAVLCAPARPAAGAGGYERWRRTRLAALRVDQRAGYPRSANR
jgi:hypothetical protein